MLQSDVADEGLLARRSLLTACGTAEWLTDGSARGGKTSGMVAHDEAPRGRSNCDLCYPPAEAPARGAP
jgi:hypothetical protein